ncbi:LysM peptidoglycan-binding domain-containing protein [Terrabacter terrigena]|uniref:LysM peptidoglycan-binding domain-containing protein n=1 Tax=Terrabacter terrigena TaxID=574718 RepID=A0ABW3MUF1_9MICO
MHRGKHTGADVHRVLTRWRSDRTPRPSSEARQPREEQRGPRLPGLAMAVTGLVVAVVALRLLSAVATRGTGAPSGAARPDDVLLVLMAWVGVALAVWLALGSLLGLLAALPGTAGRLAATTAERITPVAARRALTLVLGASVGSVALPPAPVSSAGSAPLSVSAAEAAATGGALTPADLGPGFVPSRAVTGPTSTPSPGFAPTGADVTPAFVPTPGEPNERRRDDVGPGYVPSAPPPVLVPDRSRLLAPSPRPTAVTHDVVIVHRGDSLWAVAARHLGPGAGDAQVAREWPRWYAANRDVIGDDPDLLVPGQQLRPPTAFTPAPSALETTPVRAERGAHR